MTFQTWGYHPHEAPSFMTGRSHSYFLAFLSCYVSAYAGAHAYKYTHLNKKATFLNIQKDIYLVPSFTFLYPGWNAVLYNFFSLGST